MIYDKIISITNRRPTYSLTFPVHKAAGVLRDLQCKYPIKALVESYRLTIGVRKIPGTICAVGTLEFIFERYGYHVLDRNLMLCVAAWEGDPSFPRSNMLKGIAKLILTYGEALRDDQFVERIGRIPVWEIIRMAKGTKCGRSRLCGGHFYIL